MRSEMRPALLLLLLAAAWPGAAAAQPDAPGFEELMAAQQEQIRRLVAADCRRDAPEGEIVVCGRSLDTERQALPLDAPPVPGRIARLPGEAPTGMDALNAEYCLRLCNVGVKIDLETVRAIGRGIDRILHPD